MCSCSWLLWELFPLSFKIWGKSYLLVVVSNAGWETVFCLTYQIYHLKFFFSFIQKRWWESFWRKMPGSSVVHTYFPSNCFMKAYISILWNISPYLSNHSFKYLYPPSCFDSVLLPGLYGSASRYEGWLGERDLLVGLAWKELVITMGE